MTNEAVLSPRVAYYYEVPPEIAGPPVEPARAWPGVIAHSVSRSNHDALGGCEYGFSKGVIVLQPTALTSAGAALRIINIEIVGIALVQYIPRM